MATPDFGTDTGSMTGASPKTITTVLILRMLERYYIDMGHPDAFDMDGATAALLITCTDEKLRNDLWNQYIDEKEKTGSVKTASVRAVGKWWEHVVNVLGLQETTSGGW